MHKPRASDKKFLSMLVLLVLLLIIMGLIWKHYDAELDKIEKQKTELMYTDQ